MKKTSLITKVGPVTDHPSYGIAPSHFEIEAETIEGPLVLAISQDAASELEAALRLVLITRRSR